MVPKVFEPLKFDCKNAQVVKGKVSIVLSEHTQRTVIIESCYCYFWLGTCDLNAVNTSIKGVTYYHVPSSKFETPILSKTSLLAKPFMHIFCMSAGCVSS